MIISTDRERAFNKLQHWLLIKTLDKLQVTGNFFNLRKGIYEKPTANTIFNDERVSRQEHPFFPFLFNILLEILASAIKQGKEIKGIQIGKGRYKTIFFSQVAKYLCQEMANHKSFSR